MNDSDYTTQYIMVGGIICQSNLVEFRIENILTSNNIYYNSKSTLNDKILLFIELCKRKEIISDVEERSLQEWRKFRNIAAHCRIGYDKNTRMPLLLYKNKVSITKEIFEDFNIKTDLIISMIERISKISMA